MRDEAGPSSSLVPHPSVEAGEARRLDCTARRTTMPKRGKNYERVAQLVDRNRAYPPTEAIELAKQARFAKFDETVEVHFRTGLDPRHADQQVRATTVLPNGLGKTIRVLVFAEADAAREATAAG